MKTTAALFSFSPLILSAGCAGPMGPPLGLGPGWDELVGVATVVLIAALAYRPVRKLISTPRQTTNAASPMDVVRERYARGEINQEEYDRMKQHLS
jgi:putative membrane protein